LRFLPSVSSERFLFPFIVLSWRRADGCNRTYGVYFCAAHHLEIIQGKLSYQTPEQYPHLTRPHCTARRARRTLGSPDRPRFSNDKTLTYMNNKAGLRNPGMLSESGQRVRPYSGRVTKPTSEIDNLGGSFTGPPGDGIILGCRTVELTEKNNCERVCVREGTMFFFFFCCQLEWGVMP